MARPASLLLLVWLASVDTEAVRENARDVTRLPLQPDLSSMLNLLNLVVRELSLMRDSAAAERAILIFLQ